MEDTQRIHFAFHAASESRKTGRTLRLWPEKANRRCLYGENVASRSEDAVVVLEAAAEREGTREGCGFPNAGPR
jgi:hypothetical protein